MTKQNKQHKTKQSSTQQPKQHKPKPNNETWFDKQEVIIPYYVVNGNVYAVVGAENQQHAFNKARKEFGLEWQYITNTKPFGNYKKEISWADFKLLKRAKQK